MYSLSLSLVLCESSSEATPYACRGRVETRARLASLDSTCVLYMPRGVTAKATHCASDNPTATRGRRCRGVSRPVSRQQHKRRAAFDQVSVTPLHELRLTQWRRSPRLQENLPPTLSGQSSVAEPLATD